MARAVHDSRGLRVALGHVPHAATRPSDRGHGQRRGTAAAEPAQRGPSVPHGATTATVSGRRTRRDRVPEEPRERPERRAPADRSRPGRPASAGSPSSRPDSRIDVALPEDIAGRRHLPGDPPAVGPEPGRGAPAGYHLVRRDGTVLDGARSLRRAAASSTARCSACARSPSRCRPPSSTTSPTPSPPPSSRDRQLWSDSLMRVAGLIGGGVLLVLMAFVLWFADPVRARHARPARHHRRRRRRAAGRARRACAPGSTTTAPPPSRSASAPCRTC